MRRVWNFTENGGMCPEIYEDLVARNTKGYCSAINTICRLQHSYPAEARIMELETKNDKGLINFDAERC